MVSDNEKKFMEIRNIISYIAVLISIVALVVAFNAGETVQLGSTSHTSSTFDAAGGFQVDGTTVIDSNGYVTVGGGTEIVKHLSTTVSVDFSSMATGSCAVATTSLSGVTASSSVLASPKPVSGGIETLEMVWNGFASTTNVVGVKACGLSAGQDAAAQTWRFSVWNY